MTDRVDLTVIGAGPAGIAAAATAAGHGLTVLLLDEQAEPGGQVWRQAERMESARSPGSAKIRKSYDGAAESIAALRRSTVDYRPRATVFDVSPDLQISWLQQDAGAEGATRHGIREIATETLILATGALERPLPFPGWTLPGVMGVGALQTALKTGGVLPRSGTLVLAGQGPLLLLYFAQITALGGRVAAILDFESQRPSLSTASRLPGALFGDPRLMASGLGLLARGVLTTTPVYRPVTKLVALGTTALESVRFESVFRSLELPCSVLGIHDGVIPSTQLSGLLGLAHRWHDERQCFEPVIDADGRSSDPRVWIAGDGGGIEGADLAGLRGRLAALSAAGQLGRISASDHEQAAAPLRAVRARRLHARRLLDRLYAPVPLDRHLTDDTVICRCEGVTVGAIRAAIDLGADGPNRVKTSTRCGMGPCQGRMCGPSLVRLMASETGMPPDEIGALRVRPPLKPILLGDYLELEPAG